MKHRERAGEISKAIRTRHVVWCFSDLGLAIAATLIATEQPWMLLVAAAWCWALVIDLGVTPVAWAMTRELMERAEETDRLEAGNTMLKKEVEDVSEGE